VDHFKVNEQQGTTLTELLMALGLFGILSLGGFQLFSRLEKSESSMSAKAMARSDMNLLFKTIERDLDYRVLTPPSNICNSSLCQSFTIERSILSGSGSYRVTLNSSCRPFPAGFPSPLQVRFDQLTATQSTCIRAMNCPQGQYPELTLRLSNVPVGANLPSYPSAVPSFQLNSKSVQKNTLGMGVCAVQSQIQGTVLHDRIIIETAYLSPEGQVAIQRQESNFSSNPSDASMTLLPR